MSLQAVLALTPVLAGCKARQMLERRKEVNEITGERWRFGASGERGGATLEEIAEELGVSVERVRQIEAAALKKLRAFCFKQGVRLDDLLDSPRG